MIGSRSELPEERGEMEVRIVHARVPGRVRASIERLGKRDPGEICALTAAIGRLPGVREVRASAVTAHVLVLFDPSRLDEDAVLDALVRATSARPRTPPRTPPRPGLLETLADALRARSLLDETELTDAATGSPSTESHAPPWHALDVGTVLAKVHARRRGLTREEAQARLTQLGPNALTSAPRRSDVAILFEQVKTAPVALLAGSAVVSALTGGLGDAAVIGLVIVANAAIGFVTQRRAESILGELLSGGAKTAVVRRDGHSVEIDVAELVVGDLIVLSPGTIVGADARLVEVDRLTVDESSLTGESMPVGKDPEAPSDIRAPLGDRSTMLHRGTVVTGGSGVAVVVATGDATEVGRIRALASGVETRATPLERELRALGARLAGVTGALCTGVFAIGLLRGHAPLQMLTSAISLGVAAVPEGLPTVAITTLALGARRMRSEGALIRTLGAVESLGAIQSLCLDKTGTLTINRMTVERLVIGGRELAPGELGPDERAGDGARRVLEAIVLCSEATIDVDGTIRGTPTESALVRLALDLGVDVRALRRSRPLLRTRLRAEGRGMMSTLHELGDGRRLLLVKGSPSEVLAACTTELVDGAERELDDRARDGIEASNEHLAGEAFRVLGVAARTLSPADPGEEIGLVHLGLVAMADPPREGTRALLESFHRAGIDTVMLTGDQAATARAIARRVGLVHDGAVEVLDATDVETMDPAALRGVVPSVQVFARVSPTHKLGIVRALQENGRIVAMTGDGVNDGPALQAADVGVALGRSGTDAARELADVVLLDDRLETMSSAIALGRTVRDDIEKAVRFVLATNLSEILLTAIGIATGLGEPLTPVQLLWLNVIGDVFPELALALEPPEPGVLARPPREPSRPMFTRAELGRIGVEGSLLAGSSLGAYVWARRRWGAGPRASSLAFASVTASQMLHALSARSDHHVIFDRERLAKNGALTTTVVTTLAAQALAERSRMLRDLLGIAPIGAGGWSIALAIGVLTLLANEMLKVLWRSPASSALNDGSRDDVR